MLSTLSHFGYQNYDHVILQGTHCAYCSRVDERGEKEQFDRIISRLGIRTTIDGRREKLGGSESQKDQTMNMARSAAKLFQENLKYADGTLVRVLLADTTIGRVCETAYSVIRCKISSQRIYYAREFLFRLTKNLLANPRT